MREMRVLLGLVLLSIFMSFNSEKEVLASNYINKYKDLAIVEMRRSGIPASITLAQGLLESNYGTSRLATQANNHFGIKCKSYWRGMTIQHKDDDYNKKGELQHSCFRAYEIDIDSYVDHTNFLKESRYYVELFNYASDDYFNWAHGLKKCGYATDSSYGTKLVSKIEQYELYRFDEQIILKN